MAVIKVIILLIQILILSVNSYMNSIKAYVQQNDMYYAKLLITLPLVMTNTITTNTNTNTVTIYCPGYNIPIQCYNTIINDITSIIPNSNTITYNSNTIDDNDSIITDVNNLNSILMNVNKYKNIVIFGHSRGAAVALSSLLSVNSNSNRIVILLDPVDDSNNNAINIIKKATNVHNIKILLFSLPYGGYSKYYNTYYESSCSPNGRNAASFLDLLNERKISTSYIPIMQFGHFSLLDNDELKKLAIKNVCSYYDPVLSSMTIQQIRQSSYDSIKDFIIHNLL